MNQHYLLALVCVAAHSDLLNAIFEGGRKERILRGPYCNLCQRPSLLVLPISVHVLGRSSGMSFASSLGIVGDVAIFRSTCSVR